MPCPVKAHSAANLVRGNRLLDHLSRTVIHRLLQNARLVQFMANEMIAATRDQAESVYFPVSGLYSKLLCNEDGRRIEVYSAGRDDILGLGAVLGVTSPLFQIVTRMEGLAYQVPVEDHQRVMASDSQYSRIVQNYVAYSLYVLGQNRLCYASHRVRARTCRLILSLSKIAEGPLKVTHETLAEMLGIQRPSMSSVAKELHRDGIIHYSRGNLRILDSEAISLETCDCYYSINEKYKHLIDANLQSASLSLSSPGG